MAQYKHSFLQELEGLSDEDSDMDDPEEQLEEAIDNVFGQETSKSVN